MLHYHMFRRCLFYFLTTCLECSMNVMPLSLRSVPLKYETDRATQSQDLSGRIAKSTAPMNQFKYGVYRIQRLQRLTLTQAQNLSWQEEASGHIHRHMTYRGKHSQTASCKTAGPFLHLRPHIAREKHALGFTCILNRPVKFEIRL